LAENGVHENDLLVLEEGIAMQASNSHLQASGTSQLELAPLRRQFEQLRENPVLLQRVPEALQNAVLDNNFNAFFEQLK
jgi:hypothetical protein